MRNKEQPNNKDNIAHVFQWHTCKGILAVARSCSMLRYVWIYISVLLLGVFPHSGCLYVLCGLVMWVPLFPNSSASVLYTCFSIVHGKKQVYSTLAKKQKERDPET